jgi:hypothetical protein
MIASRQVSIEVLGHLEHRCFWGASEDRMQLSVGDDLAPVLRVLTAIVFDVAPELAGRLSAGMWARSDYRGQLG